jgi:hypothetical protein
MEVMGEASVKLKPSASKVSRKDLPNRSYKQPIKMARQKSTVEPCNDSVSGIKVLQQKPDSRQLPKTDTKMSTRVSTKLRPPSGKEKEQSRGKGIPTSSTKQASQSSTVRVIEEMGREAKTTISTCTKNEVFLPESWSVLNR